MTLLQVVVFLASCPAAWAASMSLRQPSDSSRLLGSDMHIVIEKVDAPTPTDFLAPSLSNDPVDMEPRFISSKVTPNNVASFYHSSGPYVRYVMDSMVTWLIWVVLMLLIWMTCYPDDLDVHAVFAEAHPDPVKTFTSSHFGCFKTPKICLCALFCPALRWADTIDLTGLKTISSALCLFFLFGLLNCFAYCIFTYGVFTCFLILYYRHKIRALLGLPNWTPRSCCTDCFYVFCCPFCAIAQEARVVRQGCQITNAVPVAQPSKPARVYLPSSTPPDGRSLAQIPEDRSTAPSQEDRSVYAGLPDAVLKRIVT